MWADPLKPEATGRTLLGFYARIDGCDDVEIVSRGLYETFTNTRQLATTRSPLIALEESAGLGANR